MMQKVAAFAQTLWEGFIIAHKALMANKTRTLLTTLGIVIGVVTVTMMMMIIQGLNRSFADQISFLGSNTVHIQKFPWVFDEDFWTYRNRPKVTMEDYKAVRKFSELAESVSAAAFMGRSVTFRDKTLEGVAILGVTETYDATNSTSPEFGRFISASDNRAARQVCVIGVDVQREVFGGFNPLGRDVRIAGKNYQVIGILERQGNFFGQTRDNLVLIPIQTMMSNYGINRSIRVSAKAREGVDMDDLIDELRFIVRRERNLRPAEEDDFSINQQEALQNVYDNLTAGVYAAGLVIGGISLIVGGIGIMNIMLVSVTERTWEIGMRKAVGARTSHILWQFLVESMMICTLGGSVGILLALLGGMALRNALPAVLPPWVAGMAVLFSAAVGLVFGLFPAAKAARMNPITALRAE